MLEQQVNQIREENRQLREENRQLQEEVSQLRQDLAALKETVSALVARNINAKPDRHNNTVRKSPSNHARKSRNRPAHIDSTIQVDSKTCANCGSTHLSEPTHTYTRTVEDIIPARVIVTRYIIVRRYCRNCKRQVSGTVPDALPNERFGLRLMILIVSLKLLGLSYQKITSLLEMLFGIDVTESTINHAVSKIAASFGKRYNEMVEELKTELNIHGDETSWPINGRNHWLWAFVGKWTTLYEIDRSRGSSVPEKILGDYDGNVTSDSWPAWNSVGRTRQRCHIHYIRELDDTIQYKNPGKEFVSFAKCLKKILYASQGFIARKKDDRARAKKNLEQRIQRLVCKKYTDRHCVRFVKRLRREKRMLFTFLDGTTDYHNNAAERAIRPNVIIRKITNGHRSENGAHSHKILMSVRETCRMRGLNFYDYALEYLGRIASKS